MTNALNTVEGDQERRDLALRITDGDLNLYKRDHNVAMAAICTALAALICTHWSRDNQEEMIRWVDDAVRGYVKQCNKTDDN